MTKHFLNDVLCKKGKKLLKFNFFAVNVQPKHIVEKLSKLLITFLCYFFLIILKYQKAIK